MGSIIVHPSPPPFFLRESSASLPDLSRFFSSNWEGGKGELQKVMSKWRGGWVEIGLLDSFARL